MQSYINNLFTASVVYYQSVNIASFDLASLLEVLKTVQNLSPASLPSVQRALGSRVHHRDVSGYLSLGWHTGLLGYYIEDKRGLYTITNLGVRLLNSCVNPASASCTEELKSTFSTWTPYVVISEFARKHGFNRRAVVEVLGNDMLYWTGIMLKLGLPLGTRGRPGRKPIRKPFNDYVVSRLFAPLINTLGLAESRGTAQIYWSRRGEPIAAAGVASTIVDSAGGRVFMTTYVADNKGLDLVLKSVEVSSRKPDYIAVAVHKPKFSVEQARTAVSNLKSRYSVDIEIYRVKPSTPLHAKFYANEKTILISSANLAENSLLKNIEFVAQLENKGELDEAEAKITAVADRLV